MARDTVDPQGAIAKRIAPCNAPLSCVRRGLRAQIKKSAALSSQDEVCVSRIVSVADR
jgi:hypothetical protein